MECLRIDYFEKHMDEHFRQIPIIQSKSSTSSTNLTNNATRHFPDNNEPNLTARRCKFKNDGEKLQLQQQNYKFLPTNEHLIYSSASKQALCMKSIARVDDNNFEFSFAEPVCTFPQHKTPIQFLVASCEGWLICSCSEDAVILWKWDSLLKNWDHQHIGVDLGRITAAAVCFKDNQIFTSLARTGEIFVIECVGDINFSTVGKLDLIHIYTLASIDNLTETHLWLGNVFFDNILHLVGLSSASGVSLKVWSVSLESTKLKFRSALQLKALCTADLLQQQQNGGSNDSVYVVAMSSDGFAEVYDISASALTLINRLKIDDPQSPSSTFESRRESHISTIMSMNSTSTNNINNTMIADVEFRILSTKFFIMNKLSDSLDLSKTADPSIAGENDSMDHLPPPLDYSLLTLPKHQESLCQKLHVVIASSKGILIVNIRSGECELQLNYQDMKEIDDMIVSNVQIGVNFDTNEIICGIHPLFQNALFTFRITVQEIRQASIEDTTIQSSSLSLISLEPVVSKSVLRKKLKSPPRSKEPVVPIRKQFTKSTLLSNNSTRLTKSPSKTSNNKCTKSQVNQKSESSSTFSGPDFQLDSILNQSLLESSGFTSARRSKSSSSNNDLLYYNSKRDLPFNKSSTIKNSYETKLSDGLSYMRLTFSSDGNFLAACGNLSPLVVYKVKPRLENVGIYRDKTKVSSVGFSFDTKYMILATNDGKTNILNWKFGHKIVLSLDFTSKFNEHIHSQFYYLDKFILQPEENRITLYSYRFQGEGSSTGTGGAAQKLKAGSFTMPCQNITSLAAANQLYSNVIFCGGSNKSLYAFDANTETISWTAPNAHSKPITCIRLNEAPKGSNAISLCDYILTSSNSCLFDPIKLWDLRIAKCAIKIADNNINNSPCFTRPCLSPCGRYIASGFEENSLAVYDIRKINSRLTTFKGLKSPILDTIFDPIHPMLWAGSRNGHLWNFIPK